MKEEIETRELIVLEGANIIARGTYHKPYRDKSRWQPQSTRSERTGIFFLNSLSPTRAAHGDSAVYWADAFAQRGYPAFRIDMPGFGDSEGEPPPDLLKFINTGGYASQVADKAAELVERYSLSGVIIVGLCAGAVSALFAAAACRQCKGLILMDPYFHLPLKNRSRLWQTLTGRISRSVPGRFISAVYDKINAPWVFFRGDTPPENANLPLLSVWKTLSASGLPMLVFKATGTKCPGGEFDYLKYLLNSAGCGNQVAVKVIDGAGHTFSNTTGRTGVRQETIAWLTQYFSFTNSPQKLNGPAASGFPHDSNVCEKQDRCVRA
jgi:alpha-beta hydrolase superfamily lysophospholipase